MFTYADHLVKAYRLPKASCVLLGLTPRTSGPTHETMSGTFRSKQFELSFYYGKPCIHAGELTDADMDDLDILLGISTK